MELTNFSSLVNVNTELIFKKYKHEEYIQNPIKY